MVDPIHHWFKIRFTQGDPLFLSTLASACQRIGAKDFAIYTGANFGSDPQVSWDVLYFSPSAALVCEDLTKPFQLEACERTELHSEFARFHCGDAGALAP